MRSSSVRSQQSTKDGSTKGAGASNGSGAEPESVDTRALLRVLTAFSRGDFSARMPVDDAGLRGKIADLLNEIIERNQLLTSELDRISRSVGKEGRISQRADLGE